MARVSPISYERPIELSVDPEEDGLASDESATLSRIKLGTAWMCATLAGVAALAYASFAPLPQMPTMLGLGVLLAAYAAYGYSLPKKNTVQYADSVYYMGFLWTLFALIAALVVWPMSKLTSDVVLTTFGYALTVTFCGMLLRLGILHFHHTLPDRLVDAEDRIDGRLATLVQHINDATQEMAALRNRAASDLGGALYDVVRSLAEVREKMAEQHLSMAKATSEGFESSLREILDRLSTIHIPQELLTAEVATLAAAVAKQGEQFEKAAAELEERLMHTAETVTAFGDSLYESAGAHQVGAAINDLSGKIKERTEQFAEITTLLQRSRAELDGQLNSLQSLGSAVAMVSTQLSAFEAELKHLSSPSMSVELKEGLTNVQNAIRSSLDASKAIESTMRDVLFFMRERVTEERSSARH
jgi:uncharacterized phage infection (PIP) family protein YhgE